MAALKAKHKRWAIEYINPKSLESNPKATWKIWHWYKSEDLRDAALSRLKRMMNSFFVFRAKDVLRDASGRKIYKKEQDS